MNAAARAGLIVLLALPIVRVNDGRDEVPESAIATLWAQDDVASSIDFRTGGPGGRLEDGEVHLDRAQLAFGSFVADRMTIGFVRDERAALLDLGELYVEPQLRARDEAEEFPISVFHTLDFDGARFSYVAPGGDERSLERADRLLGTLPAGIHHFQPVVGHTYLLRTRHDDAGSTDELFKFQVIDLQPGRSLTIRWAQLPSD